MGSSPLWRSTLLILTYDEHGGYYDHVSPPAALAPDAIPPMVQPGESTYDGFHRYGFRVPSVLVGPYVKRDYVSHVVYDHTSILAFLERKWNLPALTYRDANANDLTDFLDLGALAAGQPTFPELPTLAAPGDTPAALACLSTGPGTIPPASAAPLPAPPVRLEIKRVRVNRRLRGLVVELETNRGSLSRASSSSSTTASIGWRAHGWRTCRLDRYALCCASTTRFRHAATTRSSSGTATGSPRGAPCGCASRAWRSHIVQPSGTGLLAGNSVRAAA